MRAKRGGLALDSEKVHPEEAPRGPVGLLRSNPDAKAGRFGLEADDSLTALRQSRGLAIKFQGIFVSPAIARLASSGRLFNFETTSSPCDRHVAQD